MILRENKTTLYLAIIALISWILLNLTGLDKANRGSLPAHSPDYYSTGYTKWEMSEIGTLKNKLHADKMTHFSDDHTTLMDKPVFFSFSGKKQVDTPPWIIASETGLLAADGKMLLLSGQVTIDRAGSGSIRPVQIKTSNLKVKPDTSYAETDEWAELISIPNRTTGIGMKLIFMQPIHLELFSHVKGKYETK
ncbi:MAG: LPS export ABC transporter periplasmic protein LptC [Methylovulum sp.]|nr:LPS export ABC transporter periplasmic protein LptC [Methylovulum sp.]